MLRECDVVLDDFATQTPQNRAGVKKGGSILHMLGHLVHLGRLERRLFLRWKMQAKVRAMNVTLNTEDEEKSIVDLPGGWWVVVDGRVGGCGRVARLG